MRDGFIKTAAVTPKIRVADVGYNTDSVLRDFDRALAHGAKIVVFPELVLTAYTCADLFLQDTLLRRTEEQLARIKDHTRGTDALLFVGLPLRRNGVLYNVAAAIQNGRILAFIPKRFLPNYSEFYEERWFAPGPAEAAMTSFRGDKVPFGSHILLDVDAVGGLSVGTEICEDLWIADSPDRELALAGATMIVNLSASDEVIGKEQYRELLVSAVSGKTLTAYIYADAGDGESSTDLVFGAQNLIAENGTILARGKLFEPGITYADVDIARLVHERQRMNTSRGAGMTDFGGSSACTGADPLARLDTTPSLSADGFLHIPVHMEQVHTDLTDRFIDPHPFVPQSRAGRRARCEEIFNIQARGLAKRCEHTNAKSAVIGISGGLDSTLALLVTARAFDLLGKNRSDILAVTMPAFGTTDRTYTNACEMAKALGATLREINVKDAVNQHFHDIGHDPSVHDVTYENSQARERTQILMDLANQTGGLVIGTGDMSEMALGWCTYNGDHMSMYAVNIGVPKTLVRHLVQYCADTAGERAVFLAAKKAGRDVPEELTKQTAFFGQRVNSAATAAGQDSKPDGQGFSESPVFRKGMDSGKETAVSQEDIDRQSHLQAILEDVLATPVSPELLPPTGDGKISQKTEDLVGPYELHDFFLYHMLRWGSEPAKILRLAQIAFGGRYAELGAGSGDVSSRVTTYDEETIRKWLKKFYWRFFSQQFKRSCVPDGPKVGSVALSPRGDLRMPSDAVVQAWIAELQ